MPATSKSSLVILFDDEIRGAAKLLWRVRELRRDPKTDDSALWPAMRDALNACLVALAGAEDDSACVLLARKGDIGLRGPAPESEQS